MPRLRQNKLSLKELAQVRAAVRAANAAGADRLARQIIRDTGADICFWCGKRAPMHARAYLVIEKITDASIQPRLMWLATTEIKPSQKPLGWIHAQFTSHRSDAVMQPCQHEFRNRPKRT